MIVSSVDIRINSCRLLVLILQMNVCILDRQKIALYSVDRVDSCTCIDSVDSCIKYLQ